nr:hypothetical protein [Thiomonas sp.]
MAEQLAFDIAGMDGGRGDRDVRAIVDLGAPAVDAARPLGDGGEVRAGAESLDRVDGFRLLLHVEGLVFHRLQA